MLFSKYGIELETITESDIERIRKWRNSNHVRTTMQFQKVISGEMQKKWFKKLNKASNIYFIIKKDSKKIGVVNLKEINYATGEAEAGIFIGEQDHINTLSPTLATIGIMEFGFEILKLKTLKAKIGRQNYKAILFNESLGYKKVNKESDSDFSYYETTHKLFTKATQNIRITLDKINLMECALFLSQNEMKLYGINNDKSIV